MTAASETGRAPESGFLDALRRPRVLHLLTAAGLARIASAAMPLALLVSLAGAYGYRIAATIDGVYTLLLAVLSPLRGRVVDRIGQRQAMIAMGAFSTLGLAGVVVAVDQRWPWPVALALVVAAGITSPPLDAALRVSWRQVVDSPAGLKAAHTADSMLDEIGFIAGPALAGLGFALLGPRGTYGAVVVVFVAALCLYMTAAFRYGFGAPDADDGDEPAPAAGARRSAAARWLGPLMDRRMLLILVPMLVMGFIFGGLGVFVPAYAEHLGKLAWSGPLIALISVGGVLGGLVYGARNWRADLWSKYRMLALGFATPACFLVFGESLWVLGALLFLSGLFVTPLYINGYLLVDSEIPMRVRHEANMWLGASTDVANGFSAITVGYLASSGRWVAALGVLSVLSVASLAALLLIRAKMAGRAGDEPVGLRAETS